jgi:Fic family protein
LAYIQPFADGNKRTSRLSANMPLMLYNCVPLSFLDVERSDYATAMLGIYEQCNVAAAVELFEFITAVRFKSTVSCEPPSRARPDIGRR